MSPKISVVMPVWNGEKYLHEAVDSILTQSFADFEFLIVDDGSTDSTPQILASYRDPRIRILRIDHGGLVKALNTGVFAARTDWVARHDADDISLPHRLERLWAVAGKESEALLIHSDVQRFFTEGPELPSPFLPKTRALLGLKMCFQCPITHTSVMFQRQAFERAGGFLQEEYYAEDYGLWARMLEMGPFVGLRETLVRYRVHQASFTKTLNPAQHAVANSMFANYSRRFFNTDEASASRAFATLRDLPKERKWSEWLWFLQNCAPRSRWKSGEMAAWLASQTIRTALRF